MLIGEKSTFSSAGSLRGSTAEREHGQQPDRDRLSLLVNVSGRQVRVCRPRWRGNEEQRFYKVPISTRALNPRPHSLFPLRTHDYAGALSAYVRREYVWPRRASVSTSSSSSSSSSFCSECALPPSARSFPLFLTSEMPVVRWVRGGRGWPGKEPLVMIRPLTLTPWLGREPVASQPQMESFDTREEPAPQSSNLIFHLSAGNGRSPLL